MVPGRSTASYNLGIPAFPGVKNFWAPVIPSQEVFGRKKGKEKNKLLVFVWVTPLKINMEPENTPLERKIIFQIIIFRFYVNLWGCISIYQRPFQLNHKQKKETEPLCFPSTQGSRDFVYLQALIYLKSCAFFFFNPLFFKRTEKQKRGETRRFSCWTNVFGVVLFFSGAWLMESAGIEEMETSHQWDGV